MTSISAEEIGQVDLVSNGVAMLTAGPGDGTANVDASKAPFAGMQDMRLVGHAGLSPAVEPVRHRTRRTVAG